METSTSNAVGWPTANTNSNKKGGTQMTTLQREQLREVLIDYIQVLSSEATIHAKTLEQALHIRMVADRKIAQVRLLLRDII